MYGDLAVPIVVRLLKVAPGPYDLYVYSSLSPDATLRVSQFTVTANGIDQVETAGPKGSATSFVEGTNYLHFQTTIGSDGTLRIIGLGVADESPENVEQASLNGFN